MFCSDSLKAKVKLDILFWLKDQNRITPVKRWATDAYTDVFVGVLDVQIAENKKKITTGESEIKKHAAEKEALENGMIQYAITLSQSAQGDREFDTQMEAYVTSSLFRSEYTKMDIADKAIMSIEVKNTELESENLTNELNRNIYTLKKSDPVHNVLTKHQREMKRMYNVRVKTSNENDEAKLVPNEDLDEEDTYQMNVLREQEKAAQAQLKVRAFKNKHTDIDDAQKAFVRKLTMAVMATRAQHVADTHAADVIPHIEDADENNNNLNKLYS